MALRNSIYARILSGILFLVCLAAFAVFYSPAKITPIQAVKFTTSSTLPLVAIANYGPHASLSEVIAGMKAQLVREGFIPNKTVRLEESDVGFDSALIPQMLSTLHAKHPAVMVVLTTPVAQAAKHRVSDTPLIYSAITDPVSAHLIPTATRPAAHMTGSADQQDVNIVLSGIKQLLPHATRIGLLVSSAEANDAALSRLLAQAAAQQHMHVVPMSIDQSRDIPTRMQAFRGKIDCLYVGVSGQIQPALPMIASLAKQMRIPIVNADSGAVKKGLVLASIGVSYRQVGENTGRLVARVLRGEAVNRIAPTYPQRRDHATVISREQANAYAIAIPTSAPNLTVLESSSC